MNFICQLRIQLTPKPQALKFSCAESLHDDTTNIPESFSASFSYSNVLTSLRVPRQWSYERDSGSGVVAVVVSSHHANGPLDQRPLEYALFLKHLVHEKFDV
jgi:hypothetical protein